MWKIEDLIIFEDKDILVCHKPAGLAVQNARIGTLDLESMLKTYLSLQQPDKLPYLGVIHRLDQPVEGVLVFAKTSKASRALSLQISNGKMKKEYLAVTKQKPKKTENILEDYLKKDGRTNTSYVVKAGTPGGKKARLSYKVVDKQTCETGEEKYLLRIQLDTGRHHQIRVQMAHEGIPLLGDRKYNQEKSNEGTIGLCSASLTFTHPVSENEMCFEVRPKGSAFAEFYRE